MLSPFRCPESQHRNAGENRIVLVGASVRPAAQSASRAGFRVTGIDLFGDTDTLAACDRHYRIGDHDAEEIVRACQDLPVVQVGGLQQQAQLIGRLMRTELSPGNGEGQDRLRDLGYLRELSRQAGFRFPTTLEDATAANRELVETTGGWLCKQRHSCGGLGVRWYDPHRDSSAGDLIQKWVPGRAFGATLLSNGSDVRLLGVCRSLFTRIQDRPFVYAGSYGPLAVSSKLARSLIRIGDRVVAATKLRGLLNVDYLVDRSGTAWLLEINPRWSGSSELIERRLIDLRRMDDGDSLMARMLGATAGDALSSEIEYQGTTGDSPGDSPGDIPDGGLVYLKRIVFARGETRFDQARFTALLRAGESWHDLPVDGTVIHRGEPVCTLIQTIDLNDRNKKGPMQRHRALVRQTSGA